MTGAAELRDEAERSRRLAGVTPEPALRGALEAMAREFDRDAERQERHDRAEASRDRRRAGRPPASLFAAGAAIPPPSISAAQR